MGDLRKYLKSIRPRLKLVDKIVEWFSDLFLVVEVQNRASTFM